MVLAWQISGVLAALSAVGVAATVVIEQRWWTLAALLLYGGAIAAAEWVGVDRYVWLFLAGCAYLLFEIPNDATTAFSVTPVLHASLFWVWI
jgi:hypothetical protein